MFSGTDWDDAVTTCDRPCPSGISDECDAGETCFAGTPCGEGGVIAVGDTCKICPDTSSQGILSWVEIEVELEGETTSTTCGDLDYGLLRSVKKDSEECDSIRLDFSQTCCYTYPQEQCTLCRKNSIYYNIRAEWEIMLPDGSLSTCGLASKMLAPEENAGQQCVTTRDALFDACCYKQCSLCDGQGIKWWVEFDLPVEVELMRDLQEDEGDTSTESNAQDESAEEEVEDEITTCSSIDSSLYLDFVEADTQECIDIKSQFTSECCYSYPTYPCGLCNQDGASLSLLWANEVEYDGKSVSCGVVDNILNAEEQGETTCDSARENHFEDCCFDKCSLCESGAQLAWDFVVDFEQSTKTCGDIEAIFAAEEVVSSSKECNSAKEDYENLCCFTPPDSPCNVCSEYVRWDETVLFEGEETTCKQATTLLKRLEAESEECSAAMDVSFLCCCLFDCFARTHGHHQKTVAETCCYELCNVCGSDVMLDWDAVIDYNGEETACGDLKPLFGRSEIEEESDNCTAIKESYSDFCCYTPPDTPCNLCETDMDFLDAYSDVAIEFWGTAMNCSDA